MDPGQLPFANVRQRGYASKLESLAHTDIPLGSAIATAQQHLTTQAATQHLGAGTALQPEQQPADVQTAIEEINNLKAQISGVEAAVTLIKAAGTSPVSGRSSPSHGRRAVQQQPQQLAQALGITSSRSPRAAGAPSPPFRLPVHQQNAAVAGSKLVGPRANSAAARTPAAAGNSASPTASSTRGPIPPGVILLSSTGPLASNAAVKGGSRDPWTTAVSGTGRASPPAGRSSGGQSPAGHNLSSMTEDEMQAVIQDPVSHLLRQSLNILSSQHTHQAAPTPVQHSSSSISPTPIVPVTRNEAVQLENRVQEALPAGAILAAQQQHLAAWNKQQQRHSKQQLSVQAEVLQQYQQLLAQQQQGFQEHGSGPEQHCDVVSQQLAPLHQLMDSLLQEAAQQVAYHCVEHGRVVDHLRDRYAELANSLYLSISSSSQHLRALSGALSTAVTAATAAQHRAKVLERQLASQQSQAQDANSDATTWQLKYEQLVAESEEETNQLHQQIGKMTEQLWQLREERESEQLAAERAATAAQADADAKLGAAEEANHNLLQRMAFLNAQLLALREQQQVVPDVADKESQTDPPEPEPFVEQPVEEIVSESSSESEAEEQEYEPVRKKRKKVIDLLKYAKRGQVRSKLWVVKVIGQIYADKAVADAAADGQGQPRSSIAEFIMKWHLNRYGLRHMSNEALSDLLASTCHYAAAGSRPAHWFAQFCGIASAVPKPPPPRYQERDSLYDEPQQQQQQHDDVDGLLIAAAAAAEQIADGNSTETQQQQQQGLASTGSRAVSAATPAAAAAAAVKLDLELLLATPAALDFYLFCCCQLAYPNSVVALFPEGEDALPLVRSSLVMESLKAVFRYLGDPDGQALFVARKLDAAAAPAPAGTAAADSPNARISASSRGPMQSKPAGAAAAAAMSSSSSSSRSYFANPSSLNSSSSTPADLQQNRELASKKTINMRVAAAEGAFGSSGSSSSRERGSFSSSASPSGSSIVGGFGYYSAWALLDLLMSEWVNRVTANGQQMAELRRAIASMQPSLQSQYNAAAEAAEATKPTLLSKLQDAKATLDQQLKPPLAAAAAAAELARSRRRSSDDDDDEADDDPLAAAAAAAAGSSAAQRWRDELQPHLLAADATMVNAGAAWQAYQSLMAHIQAIYDKKTRPPSTTTAYQRAAAAAAAAAAAESQNDPQPVTAEAAAAELQAAAQQGVMLSGALQQQLRDLGLDANAGLSQAGGNAQTEAAATAAAAANVGTSVMQDVLKPGGMANALQLARAKRAAAAAAAGSQAGSIDSALMQQ